MMATYYKAVSVLSVVVASISFNVDAAFFSRTVFVKNSPLTINSANLNNLMSETKICSIRSDLNQFDFSSCAEWDRFYKEAEMSSNSICTDDARKVPKYYDWHASLPNELVIGQIPDTATNVVVVGCGTSYLPQQLYNHRVTRDQQITIVCLDYSKICIDQLQHFYEQSVQKAFTSTNNNSSMSFVHGDATCLVESLGEENIGQVDVILDKGLIDALMCGDGWDGDVERLFSGVSSLLRSNGLYLLISYKLSRSVQALLMQIGEACGIDWKFDIPPSTPHVSFSIGRKK